MGKCSLEETPCHNDSLGGWRMVGTRAVVASHAGFSFRWALRRLQIVCDRDDGKEDQDGQDKCGDLGDNTGAAAR